MLEGLYRAQQVDEHAGDLIYPNFKDPNLKITDTIGMFIADTTKLEKDFLLELQMLFPEKEASSPSPRWIPSPRR